MHQLQPASLYGSQWSASAAAVAEKSLERAKTLFKTLRPGVDPERLLNGLGLLDTPMQAVPVEHVGGDSYGR